jgi:hypothetical protein
MKLQTCGILKVEDRRVHKRGAERSTMMLITAATTGALESSEGEVSEHNVGDYPRNENNSRIHRGRTNRRVGMGAGTDQPMSLATAAREYIWMYDINHGLSDKEIAVREGLSIRRIRSGVERARQLDNRSSQNSQDMTIPGKGRVAHSPPLIPLFPVGAYTPQSPCPHREPIEKGSAFCCMVCHRSGMDEHPALQRDPQTDPAPESKPEPAPQHTLQPKASESLETRKQRRRRKFAQQSAPAGGCSEESRADDVRSS